MRLERLVIEANEDTFALDLHDRLTVVGGIGRLEREGIINELIGALAGGREGVHLELRSDGGAQFAVFRPTGARHRIVEIDTARDVTDQFSDEEGLVNVLARTGFDPKSAKTAMRIGSADLLTTNERDALVQQLAHANQNELWVTAESLGSAQRRLDDEAAAAGSTSEDAEIIEEIESRHAVLEAQQDRAEAVRKVTYFASGIAAILTVPAMIQFGLVAAGPLCAIAALSVLTSILAWRRVEKSKRSEELILTEFGASSYLGFHIQRVNGLLSSDQARRKMMQASEDLREAQRRWSVIAGDVELEWVLRHRDEIAVAARVRTEVIGGERLAGADNAERAASLAHIVVTRLNELRTIGAGGESFVAIFDEPFSDLEPAVVPPLLELLIRASEHQQIILLTEDTSITSWARLESMTGVVGLVEPTPDPSTSSEVALYDPGRIPSRQVPSPTR